MNALRYLNTILTVLALLLSLNLWTAWSTSPSFTPSANAQGVGIPDAGAQRKQMVDLLKTIVVQTDETNKLLESGELHVRVTVAE
ncbi:MAG: hypothetical protein WD294_09910 [Phycisphaeraceae bacterium]